MLIYSTCRFMKVLIGATGRNGQAAIISDNCFLAEKLFDEEKR